MSGFEYRKLNAEGNWPSQEPELGGRRPSGALAAALGLLALSNFSAYLPDSFTCPDQLSRLLHEHGTKRLF